MPPRPLTALLAVLLLAATTQAETPRDWLKTNVAGLIEIYRDLHQHPELSLQEEKTAAQVAKLWKAAGAEVTTGVGGHGVVGIIKNGPGPMLMLRTDLDALPVTEKTDLVYASKVQVQRKDGTTVGVMHACGHDIHMTNLIGVARYLASHKDQWSGTVMLVGQPAEELGGGAKMMLDAGLFKRFGKPDFAVALHVDSTLETGQIGLRPGYMLANVDTVNVTMRGRGGHGASPHTTIDPVVMAAHLVIDLQTLVSREMNPIEPAVITVGSIHGGTKHNIIADNCELQLTVRSYTDKVRQHLLDGIKRKAKAVAAGAGASEPTITIAEELTPAVYNDDKLVERIAPTLKKVLGEKNVLPGEPSMGGEDFSRYGLAGVPIVMFRLGSIEPKRMAGLKRGGQQPPSLHSAIFFPDAEETLSVGVTAMTAVALELLAKK